MSKYVVSESVTTTTSTNFFSFQFRNFPEQSGGFWTVFREKLASFCIGCHSQLCAPYPHITSSLKFRLSFVVCFEKLFQQFKV